MATAVPAAKCLVSDGGLTRRCYQVISTQRSTFKVLWTDALINTRPERNQLECRVDETSTFTASATLTVAAETKAFILAKMSASVAVGLSNAVTALRGSSTMLAVPGRTTVLCDRGTYTYRGTVKLSTVSYETVFRPTIFAVTAPSHLAWRSR